MKSVGNHNLTRLLASVCSGFTALLVLFAPLTINAGSNDSEVDLEDIYTIELVVFANQSSLNAQLSASESSDYSNVERWDNNYELSYPEHLVFLKTAVEIEALEQAALLAADIEEADTLDALLMETQLLENQLSENQQAESDASGDNDTAQLLVPPLLMKLDTSQYETHGIAQPIDRRSAHRVLFHQVWHQNLQARDNAPALVVNGGKRFDDHYELEGSVTLSKGRFLHINTDLWLSQYIDRNSWQAANSIPAAIPLQPIDLELVVEPVVAAAEDDVLNTTIAFERDKTAFINHNREALESYQPLHTYVLREYRKVRRDEVHCLDHPMFGVIVKISKDQIAETGRK